MIYKVERTISAFFTEYGITSDDDDLMFIVNSQFIAGKRVIRLFDSEDLELYQIRQVLPAFEPTFVLYFQGQQVGQIKKVFSFDEVRFQIISRHGPFIIEGDLLANEYMIINSEMEIIAAVSNDYFDEPDSYGVEIDDDEDDVFIMALLSVVDFLLN